MSDQNNSSTPSGEEAPVFQPVSTNPNFHITLQWYGLGILALLGIGSIALWAFVEPAVFGDNLLVVNWGQMLLLVNVTLVILSVRSIGIDELAGSICYGEALKTLEPGLRFIPVGLMQVIKAPKHKEQFQCPGEPEEIQQGDDKNHLDPGMVRPIRIVTKEGSTEDGSDVLDTRMTLVVTFPVEYRVTDVFEYHRTFGTSGNPDAMVRQQIRDICENVAGEEATQYSVSGIIANLKLINDRLDDDAREHFRHTGVEILSVRMLSPDISHEVSSKLAGIAEARAGAISTRINAEAGRFKDEQDGLGMKAKLVAEGEGKASATLANLTAEAIGLEKMKKALDVKGETLLAVQVGEAVAKNAHLILGASGGTSDALGLLMAAKAVLTDKQAEAV